MNPSGGGGGGEIESPPVFARVDEGGGGGGSGSGNDGKKAIPAEIEEIMQMTPSTAQHELARLISDIVAQRRALKVLTDKYIHRTRMHLRKQEDRIKNIMGCKKYKKITFPRYNITIHRCAKDPPKTYKVQEVRGILEKYFGGSVVSRAEVDKLVNSLDEFKANEYTKKIDENRSEYKYHKVYKLQFEVEDERMQLENEEALGENNEDEEEEQQQSGGTGAGEEDPTLTPEQRLVLQAAEAGVRARGTSSRGRDRGRGGGGKVRGRGRGRGRVRQQKRLFALRDIISKCRPSNKGIK